MSKTELKNCILSDENLINFFQSKPVYKILQQGLSIEQIHNEILAFGIKNKSIEMKFESSFDWQLEQQKNVFLKLLDKFICVLLEKEEENKNRETNLDECDSKRISLSNIATSSKIFIVYLNELFHYFIVTNNESHVKATNRKKETERIFEEFPLNHNKKNVEKLTIVIEEKEVDFKQGLDVKNKIITSLKADLMQIEMKHNKKISDMIRERKRKEMKNENIEKLKIIQLQKDYETLKGENDQKLNGMSVEVQQLLKHKLKAEQILQQAVFLFDKDIGSIDDEIHVIEKIIKAEKKTFAVWNENIAKPMNEISAFIVGSDSLGMKKCLLKKLRNSKQTEHYLVAITANTA
ncbi:CLUMA_CG016949, isoform A [Clunio marinus]|uniref:CLUMA_CG016949, isoform A n=1 Tax=Clunio marinus TaxID=568069 RepID=A0A1J1IYT5_9DIPT|nr:CLUMA_CG016949, isoform A [Clunio marinus]